MILEETMPNKGEWHAPNATCPECNAKIYIDPISEAAICPNCKKPIVTKDAINTTNAEISSVTEQARNSGQEVVNSVVGFVKQIKEEKPEDIKEAAKASGKKMIGSVMGFVGGAVDQIKTEKNEISKQIKEAEEKKKAEEELERKRLEEQERLEKQRRQIELEAKKEKAKQSAKKHKPLIFILAIIIIILAIIIGVSTANKKATDTRIPVTVSASKLNEMNYETAKQVLENAGFTNITLDPHYDVIIGFLASVGDVESVSINGSTSFSSDSKFNANDLIIIKYHANYSDDPTLENNNTSAEGKEDFTNIPVPEFAKRAAVVAWENSLAMDVWNNDGSDYDPAKFHSYSDISGTLTDYFFYVDSWGYWETIGENIYHVDGLCLRFHDAYNSIFTHVLSMDVTFDSNSNNYIISNLRYTSDEENEKYGPQDTNFSCFTVPQSLVEEDRDEKALDSADKTDTLTDAQAVTAFRKMGEALYPYGFKCHTAFGTREMTQYADGSWYIEMEVTITNQYGTKRDTVASAYINNTKQMVEDFKVQ